MMRLSSVLVGFWICSAALAASDETARNISPNQQCQRKCSAHRDELVKRCLDAGGSQRECEAVGQRALAACMPRCASEVNCRRQCQLRSQRYYRDCVHQGGTEDTCAQAAREFFENCIEDHCIPTCEERCALHAREGYNQCVADGGSEEDCRARAENFLATCTENCTPDCEAKCIALGREAFRRCIEEGGAQDECETKGRRIAAECIDTRCDRDCGGIMGVPCPKGQVCFFPPGECNVADNMGTCRVVGDACPQVYEPVCGCDGETYGNACEAALQGVSIDHFGPCREVCGGIMGIPCPDDQFCRFPPGECDVSDNMGLCRMIPQACPDVYIPVCGCDGITYSNECEAAVAGMSINHAGECSR